MQFSLVGVSQAFILIDAAYRFFVEQVSWATKQLFHHLKGKRLEETARKRARGVILDDIREKDCQATRKAFAEKLITKEREFHEMEQELVTAYGARLTKWLKLTERATGTDIYYHLVTKEAAHGLVAICERCDKRLLPEDVKCLSCGAFRSLKNKQLYRPLNAS